MTEENIIELVQGDITAQADIDFVVNAANAELRSGGGVAGAIHRAAGSELHQACRPLAPISPGQAVITPAFGLPNKAVIHVLGPVYGVDEPADKLLASCYREAMHIAESKGYRSLAFPAISTGAFGYPQLPAARIALTTLTELARSSSLDCIRMVLFSDADCELHRRVLAEI